jgi:Cu(I)/Ag(I) efflux system membrane protein CusA/SilA
MIERIIEWSVRNRFIVVIVLIGTMLWGAWSITRTPLDAIPDLSDNQVIVFADWEGRSPQVIEDQVTYPLASSLQGLPHIKAVRASSAYGFSMIYVIFDDATDPYFARTRVLERLASVQGNLPTGVVPALGPDGTGVGHVYWYTVEGKGYDLAKLRSIQDWYLRLQLQSVPGVAEVASIGGFVRQYQIELDPAKLYTYGVKLQDVANAVKLSNNEVGGGLVESNAAEYSVRGRGYIQSAADLENIVVKTTMGGVPVTISHVGTVQLGAETRRGVLDKNGEGEVVGGIVVMRHGENAKAVIDRVKGKLAELEKGLPEGVTVHAAYDRSDLIERSVATLTTALTEEAIIVSLVVLVFLFHARAALIIILSVPLAVLISFILMRLFGITSNIMSLGGVAIAIGVLVDAAIVMVENAYRHLAEQRARGETPDPLQTVVASAKQVGRPIFFSLLIVLLSFAPVFMLEGQEGKLFHPLAFTKSFAIAAAAILAITAVPVLMSYLLRGKIRPEEENPVSRFFIRLYRPALETALRFKKTTVAIALLSILACIPVYQSIGSEFMPDLDEGSLLFMPTTLPDVNVTEAKRIMQVQDKILMTFPEVESVLGKVGRAETSTDPAPVSMIETIITLKPRAEWPDPRKPKDTLIGELDAKLQIPGVTNGWTQPIINRINMLATGVRTDLGLKVYGSDLQELERLAVKAEGILKTIPGAQDVFAERIVGGRFLDITPNREAIARYGLQVGDVQDVIETAIGGMTLSTSVEGRERYPVRMRYARELRSDAEGIRQLLVPTMTGAQIPLSQLADVNVTSGAPMINSENGLLRSIVFLNVRGRDMGGFVAEAKQRLAHELELPAGSYIAWSGQYENQIHAAERLRIVVPIVLVIVLFFLYMTFRDLKASALVVLSIPFALIGGLLLQKALGYNFSVAVWVGYIALAGVAVETGVVMLVYLNESLDRMLANGPVTATDIQAATMEGAVFRLRPKLMTVAVDFIGLMPIMWSQGTGADVMRPLTAPMIGGLFTSTLLVLIVLPVLFSLWKTWELKRGTLAPSGMEH